jgi:peptidoglycan/LPS O-acetylase OafA/YrhL
VKSQDRFTSLDSLRGLAALTVLLNHLVLSIPGFAELLWADHSAVHKFSLEWKHFISFSVLHLFWDGPAAVLVFFVLSGFVLTLAINNKPMPYASYLLKRVVRIWLPFAAAIALMLIAWFFTHNFLLNDKYSTWLAEISNSSVSPETIFGQFMMTGKRTDLTLNPIMWSLTHEMRISVVMPVIVFAVLRAPKFTVFAAILLVVPGSVFPWLYSIGSWSILASMLQTFSYLPLFILGGFIAIYKDNIRQTISMLNGWQLFCVWAICCCLLEANWLFTEIAVLHYFLSGIGAGLLVALGFGSARFKSVLDHPVLTWLGHISYPLYLTHFIVLLVCARIGAYLDEPLPLTLMTAFLASLAAADVFTRFIDKPSIGLARALSSMPIFKRNLLGA